MILTCRKDMGITSPADFNSKTLCVWLFGNEYPFLSRMSQLGIPTDGSEGSVTVLKQGFNVDPILQKQADRVLTLKDSVYVLEDNLADPAFADKTVRFVRALIKNWKYAEENPDEAADIVPSSDETGAQTEEHQLRIMGEIIKLTAGSTGALDPADYARKVKMLLEGGLAPVISKQSEGAWTHAITDKAL